MDKHESEHLARPQSQTALQKIAQLIRSSRATIVLAVSLLVLLWILRNIITGDIQRFDGLAYQLFVVKLRRSWLTPIMESFSTLASTAVFFVMLFVISAFAPGKAPGRCAAINLICVVFLNTALKEIVQRPRPEGFRLVAETGYSFPSGHSMVSMAFYGLLIWMIWHYEKDRLMAWIYIIFFSGIIVMVGVSRIYLGVHYASDVVAGFAVSLVWLSIFTRIIAPVFMEENARL